LRCEEIGEGHKTNGNSLQRNSTGGIKGGKASALALSARKEIAQNPQIRGDKGRMLPALGYLEKYNALIKKAKDGKISAAEVQVLLGFDQAELYDIEQARDLSIAALEDWLVEYKFKNWNLTKTRSIQVTQKMKKERAKKIGEELNNTKRWHSHGYGISLDVLTKELNLLIDDYGAIQKRSDAIRAYHDLLDDYMSKRNDRGVIHVCGHYRSYM
jgi:hypothetical protein